MGYDRGDDMKVVRPEPRRCECCSSSGCWLVEIREGLCLCEECLRSAMNVLQAGMSTAFDLDRIKGGDDG